MGPWIAWLWRLLKSRKFVKWLIAEVGPDAVKLFRAWVTRLREHQTAIDEAEQINGQFSGAIIDGKRHLVVWKDGEPISAYPAITNGDLKEKLRLHAREGLKDPGDLVTKRTVRWVATHVPRRAGGSD
jgi:hypothetical protein